MTKLEIQPGWFYNCEVINVVDGDTIDCKVDFGFKIYTVMRFRLNDIDTPEIRGEEKLEGLISKEYVTRNLLNKKILIESRKRGKYNYLATVWIPTSEEGVYWNFNNHLLNEGLAEPYEA